MSRPRTHLVHVHEGNARLGLAVSDAGTTLGALLDIRGHGAVLGSWHEIVPRVLGEADVHTASEPPQHHQRGQIAEQRSRAR